MHAISTQLWGVSLPLLFFPADQSVRGLGLSDWHILAEILSKKINFRNTFYHAEPRFDILEPLKDEFGLYDFVIASEVFEHIPPPINVAFRNLARPLTHHGFVVFTVPWTPEGAMQEHFPRLCDWQLVRDGEHTVLLNRTSNGEWESFRDLAFHGGHGQTGNENFLSVQFG